VGGIEVEVLQNALRMIFVMLLSTIPPRHADWFCWEGQFAMLPFILFSNVALT
jgi:hypothetical protein